MSSPPCGEEGLHSYLTPQTKATCDELKTATREQKQNLSDSPEKQPFDLEVTKFFSLQLR